MLESTPERTRQTRMAILHLSSSDLIISWSGQLRSMFIDLEFLDPNWQALILDITGIQLIAKSDLVIDEFTCR